MTIEVLGSGGAVAVPRAFCTCRVCSQAREHPHPPYVRHSPSLYIHDLELLIDTPEEIRIQLNRSGVRRARTVLYTHWHPDHTAGIRIFESNYTVGSLVNPGGRPRTSRVILPERVAETFNQYHALAEKLGYLEKYGLVKVDRVASGESRALGRWTVTPVDLAEEIAVGFLLEGPKRVFIAMDEVYGWRPGGAVTGELDLAILPCGFFISNPVTGEPIIDPDHPVLTHEPSFDETLEIARGINARRVVFLHLNHGYNMTPEEFDVIERRLAETDGAAELGGKIGSRGGRKTEDRPLPPIQFAYDTMKIEV